MTDMQKKCIANPPNQGRSDSIPSGSKFPVDIASHHAVWRPRGVPCWRKWACYSLNIRPFTVHFGHYSDRGSSVIQLD